MNTQSKILVLIFLLNTLFSVAQNSDKTKKMKGNKVPEIIENDAYNAGEFLEYRMHYGFLTGGKASLQITETQLFGKKVHYAKAVGRTVGLANSIYHVRDVYESYFSPQNALPYKAIRNIKEGGYKFYNEVVFDHQNDSVSSQKSGKIKVPDNIFDLVSVFYYARRSSFKNLKKGDILAFATYFSNKIFYLRIKYRGTETIDTKLGKINCLKFNPVVEAGRVFDTENDVTVWISNDKNFIPVRLKMELMVGSFKTDLIAHKNLKHPLNLRK